MHDTECSHMTLYNFEDEKKVFLSVPSKHSTYLSFHHLPLHLLILSTSSLIAAGGGLGALGGVIVPSSLSLLSLFSPSLFDADLLGGECALYFHDEPDPDPEADEDLCLDPFPGTGEGERYAEGGRECLLVLALLCPLPPQPSLPPLPPPPEAGTSTLGIPGPSVPARYCGA